MSANNWSECPCCLKKLIAAKAEAAKAAKDAYGKVPIGEFEQLKAAAEKDDDDDNQTLREDWHLGVDATGEFSIGYSCSCERCGFGYDYDFKEDALSKRKARKVRR